MSLAPPYYSFLPSSQAHAGTAAGKWSMLAWIAGAEFSCRACFVLIAVRWMGADSEAGVIAGFVASTVLFGCALMAAMGPSESAFPQLRDVRAYSWVVLYLGFSGLSFLWGNAASPASSILYWASLVIDVATVILLFRSNEIEVAAHSLMKGFIAGACALAALGWLMPTAADLRLGDIDYFNTNQIANLCAIGLLMCFLLASRGEGELRGVQLLLGVTLLRSLSKSTLIAFVACIVYLMFKDKSSRRKRKWLLAAGFALACFAFLGLFETYYDIYTTTGNEAETLTGRTAIWAWALDAGLSHPLFGNGFDAMWKVAPLFGSFEARHAENELLQQFFAYGACGVGLLIGVYGSLYRQARAIRADSQRAILTAFLVYALVRGLAEAEPFDLLLPLWLITALAFLISSEISKTSTSVRGYSRPATLLGV